MKSRRVSQQNGFTFVEVIVGSAILITGALMMATQMSSQKKQQVSAQIFAIERKILAEEISKVQANPGMYPAVRSNATASGGSVSVQLNLSYVSCYDQSGNAAPNRDGGIHPASVVVDNAEFERVCPPFNPAAPMSASVNQCSFTATHSAGLSGVCDPATAEYESQIYPEDNGREVTVWVLQTASPQKTAKRGVTRAMLRQLIQIEPSI